MKDTLILIPTYNEKDNIGILIDTIFSLYPDINILEIDDNSIDGTLDILDRLSERYGRLKYIVRIGERGLGTALLRGYREAVKSGYKYLIQMDADLQHDPSYISDIYDALVEGYDLVIASRYVEGGTIKGWSIFRRMISWGANKYASFIVGAGVRDYTSGFRGFRVSSLAKVIDEVRYSKGYIIQVEVVKRFYDKGMKIYEVPFTFKSRGGGRSKLGFKEVLEYFIKVLRLKF